jgi:pimeloyl-ACP methyl ester carboxylesterase
MWIALAALLPIAGALTFVVFGQAQRLWWSFRAGASADAHPKRVAAGLGRELLGFAVAGWWHLRAFFADGLRRPRASTGRVVVCVHGFTQNGTNMWGIRQALERVGRPTRAISLGRFGRDLHDYLPALVAGLRENDEIDLVAHSMGGVLLRMALDRHPELRAKVRSVVTLGSPHGGTAACDALPQLWEFGGLSRRSAILARLPHFGALVPHARITTIAAQHDAIVFPPETCHQPGSVAIELEALGHVGLLTDAAAIACVIDALEPGYASATTVYASPP